MISQSSFNRPAIVVPNSGGRGKSFGQPSGASIKVSLESGLKEAFSFSFVMSIKSLAAFESSSKSFLIISCKGVDLGASGSSNKEAAKISAEAVTLRSEEV